MKKLQFLPLMALVLGLGLTIAMSSFKSARLTTTWVYVGQDLQSASDVTSSNYVQNPGTLPDDCGSATDLPCQFFLPTEINTIGELETYLDTEYGLDPAQIRDNADSRKSF